MSGQDPSVLDAHNSCSFIRVGGRIVYPGVGGNAFSFSDKPPEIANAHSMPDLSNIPEEAEEDEEEVEEESHDLARSRTSSNHSNRSIPAPTLASIAAAATAVTTAANTANAAAASSANAGEVTPTARRKNHSTVGMPPKLPRPPAAHLPPPLPSKPPTGSSHASSPRSRGSSISSRSSSPGGTRSSRYSEYEQGEHHHHHHNPKHLDLHIPHQQHHHHNEFGDDTGDMELSDGQDGLDDQDSMPSPTFFRTSGTLTVALSPTRKTPSTSPSRGAVNASPNAPQARSEAIVAKTSPTSLVLASAGIMSATVNTPRDVKRKSNKRGQLLKRDRSSSDGCVFVGEGAIGGGGGAIGGGGGGGNGGRGERGGRGGGGGDTGRPATPDSGIDCHLDARGYEVVPANAQQDLQREGGSDANKRLSKEKIIPPEISSLRKGTVGVADLLTSALVSYKNKSKTVTRKATSSKEKVRNGSPPVQEATSQSTSQASASSMPPTAETTSKGNATKDATDAKEATEVKATTEVNVTASSPPSPTTSSNATISHIVPGLAGQSSASFMYSSWPGELQKSADPVESSHSSSSATTTQGKRGNSFRPTASRTLPNTPEVSASEVSASETESEASTISGSSFKDRKSSFKKEEEKKVPEKNNSKKTLKSLKKAKILKPPLEKAPKCRKCNRQFGLRRLRHHCKRCYKSFCDQCLSASRYDVAREDGEDTMLSRVCSPCTEEVAMENSRGQTRGLWSTYQELRSDAKLDKGLDVTSKADTSNREQTIHDLTPLLRKVCVTFLVELQEKVETARQRSSYVSKVWEGSGTKYGKAQKAKMKDVKGCTACHRQLRYLTESRLCDMCGLMFCTVCTAKTLQLFLPVGTNLSKLLTVDMIKLHIKTDEKDEILGYEASETYSTCLECENTADKFIKVLQFNRDIPDLEAEMFDLQRHIDHAVTYAPPFIMRGIRKAASTSSLAGLDSEAVETNLKLAHRLYDRFTRAYQVLENMQPQTPYQKLLHRHIKQAMYDLYLKRRDQLRMTLIMRGSMVQLTEMHP